MKKIGLISAVTLGLLSTASAQWTVTNITNESADLGFLRGGSPGAFGTQRFGDNYHATYWDVANGHISMDLHDENWVNSEATSGFGSYQFGRFVDGNESHAVRWSGTAASAMDFNPFGYTSSYIHGAGASGAVGSAFNGVSTPILWNMDDGTPANLLPAGAVAGSAFDAGDVDQVGFLSVIGGAGASNHAVRWFGSAETWVDLNFDPAVESVAYGTYGGRQVGYYEQGGVRKAVMWFGTAASWVDLNPLGATSSSVYAIDGNLSGGYAQFGGGTRASVWDHSGIYEDLHQYLDPGFVSSTIYGIVETPTMQYVYGTAANADSSYAMMWSRANPVPEPGTIIILGIGAVAAIRRQRN